MRKLFVIIFFIPFIAFTQSKRSTDSSSTYATKNIIKLNLSSLALNNFSFTFEKLIKNKVSFVLGYRFMNTTKLPYQTTFSGLFNDPVIDFTNISLGNNAVTGEFRFYSHKNMRGFYIAPYGRYANFNLSLPVSYTSTTGGISVTKSATFSGNISSISGGILLGTQHRLSKRIVLDIWLIGAHFGGSTGNLVTNLATPLTTQEQQALQLSLGNIDVSPYNLTGTVTSANSANLQSSTWFGLRGLGINIGYSF